jgi:subtilase family serine protease
MEGDLVVALFNADRTLLVGGVTLPNFTLLPGRSIDVGTGYSVTENQTVTAIVDPAGIVEESDDTNNSMTFSIAIGNPPTVPSPFEATPTSEATPPETP